MKAPNRRSIYGVRHKRIVAAVVSARKSAGVSQADLAAAIGLKQPDLSKIESGERRLDVVEFLQIAEYLAERTGRPTLVAALLAAAKSA